MTSAGFDADEDGWGVIALGVAFLESRGEFEAVGTSRIKEIGKLDARD